MQHWKLYTNFKRANDIESLANLEENWEQFSIHTTDWVTASNVDKSSDDAWENNIQDIKHMNMMCMYHHHLPRFMVVSHYYTWCILWLRPSSMGIIKCKALLEMQNRKKQHRKENICFVQMHILKRKYHLENLRFFKLLEISYRVVIYLEGFWFSFRGFFWRLYFCMVKYLSFHNSSFSLRYFLNVKMARQGHSVTDTPLVFCRSSI